MANVGYIGMACVVMAYIVMAYIVMAYIVMAYIVMAYIVMAQVVIDGDVVAEAHREELMGSESEPPQIRTPEASVLDPINSFRSYLCRS